MSEEDNALNCLKMNILDRKQIDIILDLIDKLQKDNYKLDRENQLIFEKNIELQKENEELKGDLERDIYARDCLAQQSISKDKIKDKIKQLEKSPFVLYGQTIEILKELLEE